MSIFVQSTPALVPKTRRVSIVAVLYAAILTIMALGQLYTFEDFITLIGTYALPLPSAIAYAVAPLLIVCEVGAIPFLLRMRLSPAFRFLSMILGWTVAGVWFLLTLWVLVSNTPISTIGFLGTVGSLPPGVGAVLLSIGLGVLTAWASWGMWPIVSSKKRSKN